MEWTSACITFHEWNVTMNTSNTVRITISVEFNRIRVRLHVLLNWKTRDSTMAILFPCATNKWRHARTCSDVDIAPRARVINQVLAHYVGVLSSRAILTSVCNVEVAFDILLLKKSTLTFLSSPAFSIAKTLSASRVGHSHSDRQAFGTRIPFFGSNNLPLQGEFSCEI